VNNWFWHFHTPYTVHSGGRLPLYSYWSFSETDHYRCRWINCPFWPKDILTFHRTNHNHNHCLFNFTLSSIPALWWALIPLSQRYAMTEGQFILGLKYFVTSATGLWSLQKCWCVYWQRVRTGDTANHQATLPSTTKMTLTSNVTLLDVQSPTLPGLSTELMSPVSFASRI